MRRLLLSVLVLVAAVEASAQSFVVVNARVRTVDERLPFAEGFAVVDGRFAAVGNGSTLTRTFPNLPVLDLGGRGVVPGLIDAHAHLMGRATALLAADLVDTASKEDIIARLRAFEAGLPAGAWLTGRGWDQNDWPAARDGSHPFPTRADLDAAFPDRPVWLERIDGHASWGNTAALRAAGGVEAVGRMQDPVGGRIERDAGGRPTGVFIDAAAGIVERHVPPLTPADYDRGLTLALQETARYGLTGVHEAGVDLGAIRLYRQRIAAGTFPLRLYGLVGGRGAAFDSLCNLPIHGEFLTVRSVKYYLDGALGSRGAALLAPYSDAPDQTGLLFRTPEEFEGDVRAAVSCGYQVGAHAIGDRANRVALDAFEAAGDPAQRHRIEHAQVIAPGDIPRFARLGVIAAMQPTHATSDLPWAGQRVGAERLRGAYAWRSLLNSGARLAIGSDFPVEQVDPLLGLAAAATRADASGQAWSPEERLTRAEALRGFTLDAAYAAFMEDELGSITPGKRADFVVLSGDYETASDLRNLRVEATYLGGRKIFEAR
jgi:predicted amidohydrolase YtcJ